MTHLPLEPGRVNPWPKNGYFPYPPRTQNRIFYPLGHFLSCDPQTALSNFTPSDSFPCQFYPPRTVLSQFYPPRTAFFTNFVPSDGLFWQFYPPQTIFRKLYPPRTPFLETPSDKTLQFFTSQVKIKDCQYSLGQGDLNPSDKKVISPPPVF